MPSSSIIAVTSGEPAGIGPELCLSLLDYTMRDTAVHLVLIADRQLMDERAQALGFKGTLRNWTPDLPPKAGTLDILHISLPVASIPGRLDPRNSSYVLALLDRAIDGCQSGKFAAMVTAPVHKGVINDSGIHFTGHTEYLAEKTQTPHVVMMLAGENLKVALATTHLALKNVPAALTQDSLEQTLRILHADLRRKYGLPAPRILVAGLNPHAGEGGYLGDEEIEVITPVLNRLRAEGMTLIGPLPADTMFTPSMLAQGDCVLAMYHDQGLTALKYATFGKGINVTLGLPIIRTSVDHGTALELAGTGRADAGSLRVAIEQAITMAQRSRSLN
jgi:4-hydroxythreonine-4-phosphate dehydrogenase